MKGERLEREIRWGAARRVPRALKVYLAMVVGLWGVSALPLVMRSKRLWSVSTLWFQAPFADFGYYYERIQLLHRPEFWTAPGPEWNYPAPCIFVYQLFYAFNRGHGGPHPVHYGFMAYLVFAGLTVACWSVLLWRAMRARGMSPMFAVLFPVLSLVLCWPIYFGMERGNIEFFLDAGIVFGLFAYMRRQWWLAAVLIGLFGAGKIYALLFLALLLPYKRWKEFLGGLVAAAAITVVATRWIGKGPVIANKTHGVAQGISSWVVEYGLTFEARLAAIDHSLYGLVKRLTHRHPQHALAVAVGYGVVAGVGMLTLFFGRIWKMPRPNQMLMVSVATVLLPPTSFDYTMALLVAIWMWMVVLTLGSARAEMRRGLLLAMVAFALLFAPETFFTWHGQLWAGQMKAVVLLGLLALSATVRFDEEAGNVPAGEAAPIGV